MLISQAMNAALNEQVGNEFGAALQYVAIASYFAHEGLPELARHFYKQAEEEREHAMRFVHYIVDAGGAVRIPAIAAPKADFRSAEEAIQLSLDWEQAVTAQINKLVDQAHQEKDHLTRDMLTWFTKEQLEEVSSMDTLLRVVQRAGQANLLYVEEFVARHHGGGAKKSAGMTGAS
jgi:ferritin